MIGALDSSDDDRGDKKKKKKKKAGGGGKGGKGCKPRKSRFFMSLSRLPLSGQQPLSWIVRTERPSSGRRGGQKVTYTEMDDDDDY